MYDLPNTKYPIDKYNKFIEKPQLPHWATPNGWNKVTPSLKKEVYEQSIDYMSKGDEHGLKEVWAEFDNETKAVLWGMFNGQQRSSMKGLMETSQ